MKKEYRIISKKELNFAKQEKSSSAGIYFILLFLTVTLISTSAFAREKIKPTIVYVELNGNDRNGKPGNINRPFASIDAALDALPKGGIVYIGIGDFASPSRAKLKSNVSLIGRKKPVPDWELNIPADHAQPKTTTPTRLTGGTVLKGTLDCSLLDNIAIRDLGVDVGSEWCNNANKGNAAEGLMFAQKYDMKGGLSGIDGIHELQQNSPPRYGILVENVSALCKNAGALVHAMLFENLYAPKISNVSTYFGCHGVVLKTIGGQLINMDAHGHGANGLIVKSNDYANSRSVNITNIFITSIEPYDGGGIRILGENNILRFVSISNFIVEHTSFGIANSGKVDGVVISNGIITGTPGKGISFNDEVSNSELSNIIQK